MGIDCWAWGMECPIKDDCNIPSCVIAGKCRFIHNDEDKQRVYHTHHSVLDRLDKIKQKKYEQADHVLTFGE